MGGRSGFEYPLAPTAPIASTSAVHTHRTEPHPRQNNRIECTIMPPQWRVLEHDKPRLSHKETPG
jgi:hypothetical protein